MKTIKYFLLSAILLFAMNFAQAQGTTEKLYDIHADAQKDIDAAVAKAKQENKNVFVQMGGDWCGWCKLFIKYVHDNKDIDSLVNANYVVVKVNYSQENKNTAVFQKYGNPERFGFPVFLILDNKGQRIHTQDSGLLEEGGSYNKRAVSGFLKNWSVEALKPRK